MFLRNDIKIDADDSTRVLRLSDAVSELAKEIAFWKGKSPLKPDPTEGAGSNAEAALELMIARFESAHEDAAKISTDPKASRQVKRRLVDSINEQVKSGGLIFSSSRKGVFIKAQFARDPRKGRAAVAYLLGPTKLEGFETGILALTAKDYFATRQRIALAQDALATATEHWEKLESDRYWNAIVSFGAFLLFLILASVGIGVFFYYLIQHPIPNLELPAIVQAITRVVLFGTLIAFVIWALRQVLRLWAVHEELRNNATERVGMLSMFAAIKGAGWLGPEDVTAIVTALFRRARSAPVVEAPPPPTPFETIAKQVTETAKGQKRHGASEH
jgi:hypothetical protein